MGRRSSRTPAIRTIEINHGGVLSPTTSLAGLAAVFAVAWSTFAPAPLQAQAVGSTVATAQPSVELPAELARVLRDYERHWSAGDADSLAALFVPEGLIVRGGGWIRGRDAIRRAYRNASGPLLLRAVEYATDGEVGFIVGAYGYGEAPPVEDRGLFTLTLQREATGRWAIVSDLDRQVN
jgi:hypothetical protein